MVSEIFRLVNISDMVKGFARRFSLGSGLSKLPRGFPQNLIVLYVRLREELGYEDFALTWASEHGLLDVVKYLVSIGADVRASNDESVQNACLGGRASPWRRAPRLEVVKYLVSIGADGALALRWARFYNHPDVVEYLNTYNLVKQVIS